MLKVSKLKKKKLNKVIIADFSLLMVAIFWGGSFVVAKNMLTQISPFYYLGIRFSAAAIILAAIFYKKVRQMTVNEIKKGLMIGLFLFLGFATQTVGLVYTTPARQGFITGLNVVMVPFLYMIFAKEKVGKKAIAGAFLATMGLSLISFKEGVLNFNTGDLLTLFCAVFFAAHIVAIAILVKKADPINLTVIQLALTGVLSLLIALVFEQTPHLEPISFLLGMSYVVIFCSVLAFLIQNVAQSFTFPTHAAIILSLEGVFGALFSWMFWGENLTIKFVIGAALILAGVIIAEFRNINKEEQF